MIFDKSKVTIFIVDDTPENISILGEYLLEYNVKVATNGPKALSAIEAGLRPDIILLDIMMPGMDGFEVCRRLKEMPGTVDIPIIFITAMAETAEKIKGFKLGAVDYITKPFQLEEVKSRIETHVSLSLYRKQLENTNIILEEKVEERTRELFLAKEKAEDANRLKSHFLALISHELRTPMVGILGYSQALMEDLNDPLFKGFAACLYDSAQRLKNTLEAILTLKLLESDSRSVTAEKFIIDERIKTLLKKHSLLVSKKGLILTCTNNLLHNDANINQSMFDVVFNNVVGNAIKYTEKGNIKIELFNEKTEKGEFVCFSVQDTGIGIPLEKQQIIFEEFRQVHEGMKRNFEGVGLGLALVKKYVDAAEGTITLESEAGKGSKFTIRLKNFKSEAAKPTEETLSGTAAVKTQKPRTSKPTILVVEDDLINIEAIGYFIKKFVNIESATDGETAIAMAMKNKYDAILMDINLGRGLSGIEVTKIIKELDGYGNIPIIACTAYAMEGDAKTFIDAGCTHYLVKPFSKEEIIGLLRAVLGI